MTHQITQIEEGKQTVDVDFSDEGIDLQGTTTVLGTKAAAARYARTFEADLKRNNSHLWPEPEPTPEDEFLTDEEV